MLMGVFNRVAAAIFTVGGSELVRDKPFQPGGKNPTILKALAGWGGVGADLYGKTMRKPNAPNTSPLSAVGLTDEERQRRAAVAAMRTRKDYQNMGRSSTLLTGPGGLGGVGAGQQKTLLGY